MSKVLASGSESARVRKVHVLFAAAAVTAQLIPCPIRVPIRRRIVARTVERMVLAPRAVR